MKSTLSFIGAGRITRIIIQALKNKKKPIDNVYIFDIDENATQKLKQQFPEISITDLQNAANQQFVFIALHPPVIMKTLEKIKNSINKNSVIISLAPKISIEKISKTLNTNKIIRLIPNATSVINKGYNPVCYSHAIKDKSEILDLLSVLGKTFETDESKLEAYAIVSAMLPTYFWFQWYKMIDIARQTQLSENESIEAVKETLQASIDTMFEPGFEKEQVLDLIPVKPIGEHEAEINEILQNKLIALYNKIKP